MPKTTRQTPFSAKSKKKQPKKVLPPRKKPNAALRSREYLTPHEIVALQKAARKAGRQGQRDETLILIAFRHALRVGELVALKWDQVDLKIGLLHVKRLKNGLPSTHPVRGIELRALKTLKRSNPDAAYVFMSERGAPLSDRTVRQIVAKAGEHANLGFTVHPHMLRHSTGFYLANKGEDTRAIQSYMGHVNIKNTVIYTELSPKRFNQFWND
jgi:type 1 fimbriae regulatory protein FimB/type 1 fimbriae regulatory protein FimE